MCQEARELVDQDVLYLIRLFYPNAYSHTVDTGLNEDLLVLVSRHGERVKKHFRTAGGLDLGYIVSFGGLGREVGEGEGGRER